MKTAMFNTILVAAAFGAIGFAAIARVQAEDPKSTTEKPAAEKPTTSKPSAAKPDQAELERRFEESMRNVALVGFFTASDQAAGKLTQERYVIEKVVKDKDDLWTFHARIQYGKHDLAMPLKIPVKWAGDTPVISVTKMAIPLLGTFDARVVLYDGQYAGTWSGAGHGGQLFGRIEKNTDKKADEKKENAADLK